VLEGTCVVETYVVALGGVCVVGISNTGVVEFVIVEGTTEVEFVTEGTGGNFSHIFNRRLWNWLLGNRLIGLCCV
jgi:hypothetical protein